MHFSGLKSSIFHNLAWKGPLELILCENFTARCAESKNCSLEACFWLESSIFHNLAGKGPLGLILCEKFTARRAESKNVSFEVYYRLENLLRGRGAL